MSERLKSIGLDVGTTSTQLVLSELVIENRASNFAVPEMEISSREVLYKSPVYLTPQTSGELVDGDALRKIVEHEYQCAGIRREDVDTGAVIITGETSRKENARRVLDALSEFAGDFVVATAGPDLESVLAAKGSGAAALSERNEKAVLHMDIGGGTTNLALIRNGRIERTGCLNVGGRLIRFDSRGILTYVSPVLAGCFDKQVGDPVREADLTPLAQYLARALESAAGRSASPIPAFLFTEEAERHWTPPEESVILSFSGGVADCMESHLDWQEFQDLGVLLGRAIRESRLWEEDYVLGTETIRATVIGAGCHSTQLSGSTVYCQNVALPLKNLPVAAVTDPAFLPDTQEPTILAWPGLSAPGYAQVKALAKTIAAQNRQPLLLCLEADMAKALGQALALALPKDAAVLCIDRVRLPEGCYLDIGRPTAEAYPVVVKTLVLR